MRLIFTCLFLLPVLGFGQLKPIAQAVEQARAKYSTKANTTYDLFTFTGIDKAASVAVSTDRPIHKLSLNANALSRIRQERREYLEISIPTGNGPVELALVPAAIFAPGFTVKTSAPDPNFSFDSDKLLCYHGVLKSDPNSLVAVTITDNEIMGMVSDSTGNRVLAPNQDKAASATEYGFYDERAVMSEVRPFGCETLRKTTPVFSTSTSVNNTSDSKVNSSCVRYTSIYFEADYAMYQDYFNNTTSLTNDILFLFNQVATIYQNDGIWVKISQLYVWNTSDPYASTSGRSAILTAFRDRWRAAGNSFPGQFAHLLSSRALGGGVAYVDVLGLREWSYGISGGIDPYWASEYPVYSWEVDCVTHELGHNFGSEHTQWCGWSGGAIDNCAPTENDSEVCNCCPRGPAPTNGGTIMSYCHNTGYGKNFANGFGPQPGALIRDRVNAFSANLPITTNDGGLQSVTSGSWTSGSTWVCGLTPSVIYDVTVNNGTTVQLNTSSTPKTLNINGTLDLSTTSSVLNINNN